MVVGGACAGRRLSEGGGGACSRKNLGVAIALMGGSCVSPLKRYRCCRLSWCGECALWLRKEVEND